VVFSICSKSNDSIEYDEYLDGGIPDTLLEGLGFYANSGDMETTSEADEIPDERPESGTIMEPHSITAVSSPSTGMSSSFVLLLIYVVYYCRCSNESWLYLLQASDTNSVCDESRIICCYYLLTYLLTGVYCT